MLYLCYAILLNTILLDVVGLDISEAFDKVNLHVHRLAWKLLKRNVPNTCLINY